jgi:membrane protease YdiL (CAAX protease family)
MRLEESFGLLPGLLLGSVLYAAYHIGYGMTLNEMAFLFFIGLMYGACFRLTRSIFILWPVFQPSGQLVTLIRDGLKLPLLASLGFVEAFVLMIVLVWAVPWFEHRRELRHSHRPV